MSSSLTSSSQPPFGWPEPSFHYHPSPYYRPSHYDFANKVRQFIDKEVSPFVNKWDSEGDFPLKSLAQKCFKAGVLAPQFSLDNDSIDRDWDAFHLLIFGDELARCGSGGVIASLWLALQIGLSPIMEFGSDSLKSKVASKVLRGEQTISLAVSEPGTASDVSRIRTSAVIDPSDPDVFIVNGEKYFITNGMKCDYFTTAVKTCSDHNKMSFLLIPRMQDPMDPECTTMRKGVYLSKMITQGWLCSNTAHIIFRNCRVHKSMLVGEKDDGWRYIMANFNTERFFMSCSMVRFSRLCLDDAVNYARQRHTFGTPLIKKQAIRHKIAEMARCIESSQCMLESLAYRMNELERIEREKSNGRALSVESKVRIAKQLAGSAAMAKVQCSRCMERCARESVQIFGGRGYLRNGRGARVERMYREVRVNAIGAGSEEIMLDLAVKQAKL